MREKNSVWGRPCWTQEEDREHELEVARKIEECWGVTVGSFGPFSTVDYWIQREGRICGVAELKCQLRDGLAYATLDVKRWLSLQMWATATDLKAIFVCRKLSGDAYWVDVFDIATNGTMRMGGPKGSPVPVVWVPFEEMRIIKERTIDDQRV